MARVRGATAGNDLSKRAASGKFLTLSDGDVVKVAFLGVLKGDVEAEPLGVEVVWIESKGGRRSMEYNPALHDAADMRAQFLWNVLVHPEDGHPSAGEQKIFQQGPKFFNKWVAHRQKKGYGYWFEIGRTGAGQFDTEYSIDRDDQIDERDLADMKQMELIDLDDAAFRDDDDDDKKKKEKDKKGGRTRASAAARTRRSDDTPPQESTQQSLPSEAKPTDAKSASSASSNGGSNGNGQPKFISDAEGDLLRNKIKELPDPEVVYEQFKSKFNCKVKELPAARFKEAVDFVDAMTATHKPPTEENDPFGAAEKEPFE